MRVFLALRRLLSASFAFWSVRFLDVIRMTEWANAYVPFANCLTVAKIGISKLP